MADTTTLNLLNGYDLTLVLVGLAVLGTAALPRLLADKPMSLPVLLVGLGFVFFALPLGLTPPDPLTQRSLAVRLTELGVIVSLMGAGLKIDRVPNWRTWASTWRLLAVTMPLTVAVTALLGWWALGLAPAAAVLLGAVLAPTDPVLAAEVQVGEPAKESGREDGDERDEQEEEPDEEREDELRFALTSEAGLNDALAFPFTYMALLMLTAGTAPANWLAHWVLVDVGYKLAVGVACGLALGWLLARLILRLPVESKLDKAMTGLGALGSTLILYGGTEVVGGYGFLAVFVGALTIRNHERNHEYHQSLYQSAEQTERLLMAGILIALGGAVAGGVLSSLTWPAALVGLLLVFAVRPAAGWIGLLGSQRLAGLDRLAASFFGIRGIGSLYYLAYALDHQPFPDERLLWALVAFVVLLSVTLHGVSAAPVMQYRARRRRP